ncbi:MAG: HAD-IA family hydrolase [Clostridiaceae bacterium]|jgi:pyrophosphatase PpaX|nr:HAD-IA family hydrolase [Clostridiaceae bacterium]
MIRESDFPLDVSAVMFDLDGTLFDTVPLIMASHRHTFNKILGWVPPDDELLATIGEPLITTFSRYGDQCDHLMTEYINWSVPKTPTHIALFDGVVPMLETLRERGFKIGVVTARRGEGMMVCLDSFGLTELFDVLISAKDTDRHKPDPAPLLFAMEKLGITQPERVLYVGDTILDLKCALNAGSYFAAVRWTAMDKQAIDSLGPTFWLDRAMDLPDKLRLI